MRAEKLFFAECGILYGGMGEEEDPFHSAIEACYIAQKMKLVIKIDAVTVPR